VRPLHALTIQAVPIDLLRPDPANPRRIGEDELDALTRSLRQFGFVQPVLARKEDRVVVYGAGTVVEPRAQQDLRLMGRAALGPPSRDLQASPEVDLSLSGFGEDEVRDLLGAWRPGRRPSVRRAST
jgi:hypothetical protein